MTVICVYLIINCLFPLNRSHTGTVHISMPIIPRATRILQSVRTFFLTPLDVLASAGYEVQSSY